MFLAKKSKLYLFVSETGVTVTFAFLYGAFMEALTSNLLELLHLYNCQKSIQKNVLAVMSDKFDHRCC